MTPPKTQACKDQWIRKKTTNQPPRPSPTIHTHQPPENEVISNIHPIQNSSSHYREVLGRLKRATLRHQFQCVYLNAEATI